MRPSLTLHIVLLFSPFLTYATAIALPRTTHRSLHPPRPFPTALVRTPSTIPAPPNPCLPAAPLLHHPVRHARKALSVDNEDDEDVPAEDEEEEEDDYYAEDDETDEKDDDAENPASAHSDADDNTHAKSHENDEERPATRPAVSNTVRAAASTTSNRPKPRQTPSPGPKNRHASGKKPKSGPFRGVPSGMVDGVNVTHLSYMVFKIIKGNNIRSVVDMPCRNNAPWFSELLHRIDFEIVGFKYYCVDTDRPSQDDLRKLFSDSGAPEFMHIRPEESQQLPNVDLIFSWMGPQQWGVGKTWAFFTGLRQVRPKYLLVTNNLGVSNNEDKNNLLNLRKQPFHVSLLLNLYVTCLITPTNISGFFFFFHGILCFVCVVRKA